MIDLFECKILIYGIFSSFLIFFLFQISNKRHTHYTSGTIAIQKKKKTHSTEQKQARANNE